MKIFEENQKGLLQPHDQDASWYDGEAKEDFWFLSGDFIYRHHVEPRVKLHMSREESFPIPLRYIDVTRATNTTLDVLLELIDDYWNIEGDRDLSDAWRGFTWFTMLNEKPPDGKTWSGERLTKRQKNIQVGSLVGQKYGIMSNAAERKEKQKWAIEKPMLDNARKLRGVYFIDPTDAEFKETIKNARKSWKSRWKQPCLTRSQEISTEKPVVLLAFAR